uniref:Uncharacterized protein n=2 Tax=Lotharella globosa TaxID=91324 RepID=A0A7S4DVP7_9EUKA
MEDDDNVINIEDIRFDGADNATLTLPLDMFLSRREMRHVSKCLQALSRIANAVHQCYCMELLERHEDDDSSADEDGDAQAAQQDEEDEDNENRAVVENLDCFLEQQEEEEEEEEGDSSKSGDGASGNEAALESPHAAVGATAHIESPRVSVSSEADHAPDRKVK